MTFVLFKFSGRSAAAGGGLVALTALACSAMIAAAAQSVPHASPPRPRPYTYRFRTNPNVSYRTLRVRLCDGFYYPLSEAS